MTDLKRIPSSDVSEKSGDTYLWVKSRRHGKKAGISHPAAPPPGQDPAPGVWRQIVGKPMRALRKMFTLS